jgi:hypothetical protein
MNIAGYNFEGPWLLGQKFNDVPGVYVIYNPTIWLDVGEADKLGGRINNNAHERQPQWISNSNMFQIYIAFLRVDNIPLRLTIESQLRQSLRPVCGQK